MKFLSTKVHTIIGMLIGLILLVTPALFNFDSSTASVVPQWVGIFIIISELTTASPLGLVKLIPMRIHIFVDYLTGILLAISPWLLDFSNRPTNEWLPHLVVGILIVSYAWGTDPELNEMEDRAQD